MSPDADDSSAVGRYRICDAIASGGMATVYFGRLQGPAGFSRTVAIKRLHPELAQSPELVAALLDEARLVSRIQHPNVVAPLDVVADTGRLLLVMEYIHGASLAQLMRPERRWQPAAPAIAAAILIDALRGLHAAHEATGEQGEPLGIVHRDVSPQNILVGVDGLARVADFGVAKARGRLQVTREGQIKGKLAYMAPEQIRAGEVSRRTDVFAAGIVLWEALVGRQLFRGDNEGQVLSNVLSAPIGRPRSLQPELPEAVDELVMTALDRNPERRYPTARAFAEAIETSLDVASASAVGAWVEERAGETLRRQAELRSAIERGDRAPRRLDRSEEPTRTATVERPTGNSASGTTETAYEAPPPSGPSPGTRSNKHAGLLVGMLLLLLGGGLVWSLLRPPTGATAVPTTTTDAAPSAPTPTPARTAAAGPDRAAGEPATEVLVEVVTTPPGATVTVGEGHHGPTPAELALLRGDEPVELTVRLAGHQPAKRSVIPDRDQRLELVLLPLPRGSRPPRAASPSRPTPTGEATAAQDFWRFE